jgi:hypothetical protein
MLDGCRDSLCSTRSVCSAAAQSDCDKLRGCGTSVGGMKTGCSIRDTLSFEGQQLFGAVAAPGAGWLAMPLGDRPQTAAGGRNTMDSWQAVRSAATR